MRLNDILKTFRIAGSRLLTELTGGLGLNGPCINVLQTIVYGVAPAIDASLGNEFVMTITDGVAFVFAAPTNPPPTGKDQVLIITYRNTSGGAHGAGTFNAIFKVSAALAAVATGFNRSIAFRWDGTNYVELWRTAADVAN